MQSNRGAIGARLLVTAGDRTQVHEVCGGDGYFASNDHRQCIGLAEATHIDSLTIRWPSGRSEQWEQLSSDSHVLCIEGRAPLVRPLSSQRK